MDPSEELNAALRRIPTSDLESVFPFDLATAPSVVFDLSVANPDLDRYGLSDPEAFSSYVFAVMEHHRATVGIGRYDEERVVYRDSPLFDGEDEPRTVHLGIDLFVAAGTPVRAPLAGVVHSLADNTGTGNYGPTIILAHSLTGLELFTLYGHLASASTAHIRLGHRIAAGATIARIGEPRENGGWPPHLHFQIITDIGHHRGDFPGVAAPSERQDFLALCPDPNLILRIPEGRLESA